VFTGKRKKKVSAQNQKEEKGQAESQSGERAEIKSERRKMSGGLTERGVNRRQNTSLKS